MHLHIQSAIARAWNDQLEVGATPRNDSWSGDVPAMTPEEIFRFFNRVEPGDGERLERIGFDLPSMSVGDVITIDRSESLRVAPVGFEPCDKKCEDCGAIATPSGYCVMCGRYN